LINLTKQILMSKDQRTTENTKTVIITGAAGGLGVTVTHHLLSLGCKLIALIHDADSKGKLPVHESLDCRVVDLANESATEDVIKTVIEKYKHIDAVVLLAGGFAMGNISKTGSSQIKEQISLNFDTAYHVVRPVYDHMLNNNSGRFIFIGARPPIKPTDGRNMIAYALSKSLLFKLAEFINADVKGKYINATVIVPSTIDTPANRKSMPDADPSKWVRPEAIAETIGFLLSESASAFRETVLKIYNNS
jgi:NAD(P)-dependent dehydrogenase (short-subunit alcohol dehydrogenase family)